MPPADIRIVPVLSKNDLSEFIALPYFLYQDDPHWVPPLKFERRNLIDPKINPYFLNGSGQLFLAKRGSQSVGRISAQISGEYERHYKERIGHFGFFEVEDQLETAQALWQAAEKYFRKNKIARVQGPFNYSINEESGLLIEGLGEPMVMMSPYNPPYYEAFLTSLGFAKVKDLYAWRFQANQLAEEAIEISHEIMKDPHVKIVPFSKKNLQKDCENLAQVFNSAWKDNWGFIPMTAAESHRMAHEIKLILDPAVAFRVEIKGVPAGVCLAVPNINEIIKDLDGNLFPIGWAKLLWRLKRKKTKSARLMILGVTEEFRTYALGGLSILLMAQCAERGIQRGYQWAELSWTLEDNDRINQGIEFMGGKRYKTFRIFEKSIG